MSNGTQNITEITFMVEEDQEGLRLDVFVAAEQIFDSFGHVLLFEHKRRYGSLYRPQAGLHMFPFEAAVARPPGRKADIELMKRTMAFGRSLPVTAV